MADIRQFLEDFLTLEEKERIELGMTEQESIPRKSNDTYKILDDEFVIKDKKQDLHQYATFYWLRLQSLKPHVKELAEIKWEDDHRLQYVTNLLDIKPN